MLEVEWERCRASSGSISATVASTKPIVPSPTPKTPPSTPMPVIIPASAPELVKKQNLIFYRLNKKRGRRVFVSATTSIEIPLVGEGLSEWGMCAYLLTIDAISSSLDGELGAGTATPTGEG